MLTDAIHLDIQGYLAPTWRDTLMSHPASLLQVIRTPRLLFDFPLLADFLIRQVVPFQIEIYEIASSL